MLVENEITPTPHHTVPSGTECDCHSIGLKIYLCYNLFSTNIPSLRDGGTWGDFVFYQHFVPNGTAGLGAILISTT